RGCVDRPHRARHERGHGHLRSRHGPGFRACDRGRHAAGGHGEPPCHRGLPGSGVDSMSAADRTAPTANGVVADGPAHGITRTMPQLLEQLAAQQPDRIAMQEKRYGIWMPTTWRVYRERVRDFAHGLAGMGVERGDIVAVLGDNRPEWLIAELAAQSLGAAVVGIYPTSIGSELTHVLAVSRARVVVAEDQEQVDKLLAMDPDPADGVLVEHIVFYDPHGLEQYDHPMLREFTAVEDAGREFGAVREGWLDEEIA